MPVSLQDTLTHLRRLEARRQRLGVRRQAALTALLPRAAELLREHGAEEVWLFGSLATEDARPDSDVDLAVRGLPSAGHLDCLADLMALFPCSVDLVRLETAPSSLVERVTVEGRRL